MQIVRVQQASSLTADAVGTVRPFGPLALVPLPLARLLFAVGAVPAKAELKEEDQVSVKPVFFRF